MHRCAHLQNIQHLQGGEALPRGWQLKDIIAMIVCRHRLYPLRAIFRQIFMGHHAAVRLHLRYDGVGDGALIKSIASLLLD